MQGRMRALISAPDANGCRSWAGAVDSKGRAVFPKSMKSPAPTRVSRLLWEIRHGEIPAGAWVTHGCGNKDCYEVSHLALKEAADIEATAPKFRVETPEPDSVDRLISKGIVPMYRYPSDSRGFVSVLYKFFTPLLKMILSDAVNRGGDWRHSAVDEILDSIDPRLYPHIEAAVSPLYNAAPSGDAEAETMNFLARVMCCASDTVRSWERSNAMWDKEALRKKMHASADRVAVTCKYPVLLCLSKDISKAEVVVGSAGDVKSCLR